MTKKDLVAMGLTEEQADKVMESLDGNFVTKNRFNELNEELKKQKEAVEERDKQLTELKKAAGDNEALTKQIGELQKANADQKKAHEAEIAQLRLDNAVDTALTAAGAKNSKAVKALLDMGKVSLAGDGQLIGWSEQLAALKESDAYLFADQGDQNQAPTLRGFQPGASGEVPPDGGVDTSKMTYSEMMAYKAANPDANVDF